MVNPKDRLIAGKTCFISGSSYTLPSKQGVKIKWIVMEIFVSLTLTIHRGNKDVEVADFLFLLIYVHP